MKKHDTPMLDELENGPWPSFISGIKRLRDTHPESRINEMTNDLLGQLEHYLRPYYRELNIKFIFMDVANIWQ